MAVIQLKDMASMGTKSYNPSFKTDFKARTQAEVDAKRKRDLEKNLGQTMKKNIQSDLENDPKYKELKKKQSDLAELKKYMDEMGATTSNPEHASKVQEVDSQIESINSQLRTMEQGSNVAGQKAELDPFGRLAAPTKTKTDADVQRELSMSPQAQGAYKAYNKGKEGIFNAYKGESKTKVADAQSAYKDMLAGANEYFMHTGKQLKVPAYSTLASAAESEAKAMKSKQDLALGAQRLTQGAQDLEKGSKAIKQMDSSEKRKVLNYANTQLDKWMGEKAEFIKKFAEVNKSRAIIANAGKSENPEDLFTTVKALAGIIEPGLSVTEGEVNGFLGQTKATGFVINLANIGGMVDKFISTDGKSVEKVKDIALSGGKGSAKAVGRLKLLAGNLASAVGKIYNEIISGGSQRYTDFLASDIRTAYGDTISSEALDQLIANMKGKFSTKLGGKISLPSNKDKAPTESKEEPTTTKDKPTLKDGSKRESTKFPGYWEIAVDGKWIKDKEIKKKEKPVEVARLEKLKKLRVAKSEPKPMSNLEKLKQLRSKK